MWEKKKSKITKLRASCPNDLWELSQNFCNFKFLAKVDHEQGGEADYEKF